VKALMHLSDKILELINDLLCLSKILLRQKPILNPRQLRDDGTVHLYGTHREHRQGLHHQEREYGIQ
jgi:hypothetical protein